MILIASKDQYDPFIFHDVQPIDPTDKTEHLLLTDKIEHLLFTRALINTATITENNNYMYLRIFILNNDFK